MARLASLSVGDPVDAWAALGFGVAAGACEVSGVRHVLGAEGKGIVHWTLRGVETGAAAAGAIDGLPTTVEPATAADSDLVPPERGHPNGVVAVDHLVVATPDLERTLAAFVACGLALRARRPADTYGQALHQGFFRLGPVVLEVIGPPEPAGDGPARFFGLAFTVDDLAETARFLGERLHPPKPAVQPGRHIATLDRGAGSTVPMAFMSPGPDSVDLFADD
jgi:catechol 2,3-dioxygenase-like lactoylglutathione lyase family enzyme